MKKKIFIFGLLIALFAGNGLVAMNQKRGSYNQEYHCFTDEHEGELGGYVTNKKCGHHLCWDCVVEWQKQGRDTCPLCREQLDYTVHTLEGTCSLM